MTTEDVSQDLPFGSPLAKEKPFLPTLHPNLLNMFTDLHHFQKILSYAPFFSKPKGNQNIQSRLNTQQENLFLAWKTPWG